MSSPCHIPLVKAVTSPTQTQGTGTQTLPLSGTGISHIAKDYVQWDKYIDPQASLESTICYRVFRFHVTENSRLIVLYEEEIYWVLYLKTPGVGLTPDKTWINLKLCHQNPVSLSSSLSSVSSMLAWVSDYPLIVARCCHTSIHKSSLAQLFQEKRSLFLWYYQQISWKLSFFGSNWPKLALVPIPEQFAVIKEILCMNRHRLESHIHFWNWGKVITISHKASAID